MTRLRAQWSVLSGVLVEITRLDPFFRGVSRWPQDAVEAAAVADRIQAFLGAPFVGLVIFEGPNNGRSAPIHGVSLGHGMEPDLPQLQLARDFLRRQLEQIMGVPGSWEERIRHLQVGSTGLAGAAGLVRNLAIMPVVAELRLQPGIRDSRRRHLFGWIVCGRERAPGPKEDLALALASQRLSELAVANFLEMQLQEGSQFLSIASHELKTPLTAIYGVLQLQERMLRLGQGTSQSAGLQQGQGGANVQQSYLKMVIRQVERLNELIDGLLDVSRIQNGRFRVEPTEADVAQILQDTVKGRLSVIAQEASVRIQVEAPAVLRARVDSVRIEEVLTNLIMNAIRFSPEGGTVFVRLRDEDGAFRVMIRDQGPPIPPEDRERIFHPFERAQRTSRLGGLGLGLFISRQIAQLHGGNVALVESVAGKGNLFEAYFPNRAASQSISA